MSYQRLLRELKNLQEAFNRVDLILSDKPVVDDVALVDQFQDAITEVLGTVEEAITSVAQGRQLPAPALLEHARQQMPRLQGSLNATHQVYWEQMAGFERLHALRRAGQERGGEWHYWARELQNAIERCQPALAAAAQAVLDCWSELVERLVMNTGTIQTTTIHQPIVVPERATLITKGVQNS